MAVAVLKREAKCGGVLGRDLTFLLGHALEPKHIGPNGPGLPFDPGLAGPGSHEA